MCAWRCYGLRVFTFNLASPHYSRSGWLFAVDYAAEIAWIFNWINFKRWKRNEFFSVCVLTQHTLVSARMPKIAMKKELCKNYHFSVDNIIQRQTQCMQCTRIHGMNNQAQKCITTIRTDRIQYEGKKTRLNYMP